MKKAIGAIGALMALLFTWTALSPAAAQDDVLQHIRLVGRFLIDGSRAAFEWPGSAIEIRFNGSSLDIVLNDTGRNSMVVEVDGAITRLDLKQGQHDYNILSKGKAENHTVRLTRRTEALFGQTILEDVRIDGSFLPQQQGAHSLLVIGDSISAGYGVEGKDTKCSFSADTENQYLTYAAVAARSYDADVISLAFSGKGLVRNYDGKTDATMSDLYRRLLPSRDMDAPLPKADVIVVHLGTNDFSNGARPADFAARYTDLLTALRAGSPDAQIYAAMGPMLAGADLDVALGLIDEVVAARQAKGDGKIAALQFTDPPGAPSRGCDWHPGEAGQEYMAEQLATRIGEDLGWTEIE